MNSLKKKNVYLMKSDNAKKIKFLYSKRNEFLTKITLYGIKGKCKMQKSAISTVLHFVLSKNIITIKDITDNETIR